MSRFCLGCMKTKSENPVCEHCGFDERQQNLPNQLPMGTVLQGQYLVGKVLGQGGFGITYMGWDQNLSIPVAIKEYFPGGVVQRHAKWGTEVSCVNGQALDAFGRYRDRFLKEARTLAQLSRIPEIVRIHSYFSENNTAYIVMEYIQGITLKERLKQLGRPMTEAEALQTMEPVLRALQNVHQCGVIHRDISPDNIMLHREGIKLIDFGTVRYVDDTGHSQSTEAILKPGFAPIEQYNTRGNVGTWTDVYAICATLHYLLTGRVPPDVHERLDQGESLTLLRNKDGISAGTIKALEKGMRIRYQERLQSIDELYNLLYARKTRVQPKPQKDKPVPKKILKAIGAIAGIAAASVAVAACIVWMVPKKERPKPAPAIPEATVSAAIPEATVSAVIPEATTAETGPETTEALTPEARSYQEAEQFLAKGDLGRAAIAFGKLGAYKDARERSFDLWAKITPRKTVMAEPRVMGIQNDGMVANLSYGWENIVAVRGTTGLQADGTLVADEESDLFGWTDLVDFCQGSCSYNFYTRPNGWRRDLATYWIGLRSDGTVVATGDNVSGQCDVSAWSDIVAITNGFYDLENLPHTVGARVSCCNHYTVGLKADGTLVVAGKPPENWDLTDWSDIVQINTDGKHIAGLKSDGTVLSTQYDTSDWKNITDIDVGPYHILGLCADSTVAVEGNAYIYGHLDVSQWSGIVAITASDRHTVGLKADGTVVAVGYNMEGQCNVSGWTDIVDVAVRNNRTVGLRSDGTAVVAGWTEAGYKQSYLTDIKMPAKRLPVRSIAENKPQEAANQPAYMAVTVMDTDSEYTAMFGAYVVDIEKDGAADRAGIQLKDIVIGLNTDEITNVTDLTRALRNYKAGDTATVKLIRSGKEITLTIVFDAKPE